MYADVVVLTYQAPEIDSYTYEVPKKLEGLIKSGQLVQVPFGKRTPVGIILSADYQPPTTNYQIKPINSIIFQMPILLSYQIKLLKWMAFYYHAPMVNCLEAIIPEIPKRLAGYQAIGLSGQYLRGEDAFERVDHSIPPTGGRTAGLLKGHLIASEKVSEQKRTSQTLVLVPSINRLPETLAKFPSAKNYAIYHSELKTTEKFTVWKKILEGRVDFVFGSRSAIFTPCPKLSKIIIFDEHDGAYKDERSPYFDSLTVAEKLQELTAAKIQIIDSSPKITTYFNNRQNIRIPRHKVPTVIVSMNDERRKGNYSVLCNYLNSTLAKITKSNSRTLLFLNKKSGSGHLYCKSCQYQEYLPNKPEVCPNCQSMDFYFNSLNIWSLAQTVRKLMPTAQLNLIAEGTHYQLPASPTRSDSESRRAKRGEPTTNYPLPTVDIATSSVLYRLLPQKYDLVAHIATDSTLNIADFTSGEKTFAEICALKNLTANGGQLILQTYNPDHPILKNAAQNNYLSYFAQSLAERKALNFPPFALLIKLTIKGKDKETLEKKAQDLTQDLTQFPVSSFRFPVSILGPYESIFSAKVPSYNIILKHKLNTYSLIEREKARQNLEIYLQKVPRDFQITIEPANIN